MHDCQQDIHQANHLEKIHCKGLWKFFGERSDYNDQAVALRNLSYTFTSGNLYLIQGKNGSGKTSLLSILAGISKPSEGTCEYQFQQSGTSAVSPSSWDMASLLDKSGMYEELSIRENIELLWNTSEDALDLELKRLSKTFALDQNIDRPLRELSLGYKQRANLARLFMRKSSASRSWYILDEPSVYLDESGISGLTNQIEFVISEGLTVILSSHDKELIQALSNRLLSATPLYMDNGRLKESIDEP